MIELNIPSSARKRFRALFLWPMFEYPQRLVVIFFALLALSLSQTLFLLMLRPFFKSLFTLGEAQAFSITELFPEAVVSLLPRLEGLVIAKETIIWLVPAGLLLAVFVKGVAGYFFSITNKHWLSTFQNDTEIVCLLLYFLDPTKKSRGAVLESGCRFS